MSEAMMSTEMLEAMLLTGAVELQLRWINELPDGGKFISSHLEAGAGLELLIQSAPYPAIGLRLVDSDGSFVAVKERVFASK